MSNIVPFLKDAAFTPEVLAAMSDAYDRACLTINCQRQSDSVKESIAYRIVALATEGHTGADVLYTRTLAAFGIERLDDGRAGTNEFALMKNAQAALEKAAGCECHAVELKIQTIFRGFRDFWNRSERCSIAHP
jgi:hypothetical protein